jgi:Cys-tRNA(Pro) deacylase
MSPWPAPVERVVRFLADAKVEASVQEFPEGTPTAEAAAKAVGCELGQIVKTLVFICDGRPLVALLPGDRRADRAKVARAAGCERAKVAGPDEVERATGFRAGGVAPFPLAGIDLVLIDRRLVTHPVVWIGAGSSRHMASIAAPDLVRLTKGREADLSEEEPRVQ